MYKTLIEKDIYTDFSNVVVALHIYLVTMITNYSGR